MSLGKEEVLQALRNRLRELAVPTTNLGSAPTRLHTVDSLKIADQTHQKCQQTLLIYSPLLLSQWQQLQTMLQQQLCFFLTHSHVCLQCLASWISTQQLLQVSGGMLFSTSTLVTIPFVPLSNRPQAVSSNVSSNTYQEDESTTDEENSEEDESTDEDSRTTNKATKVSIVDVSMPSPRTIAMDKRLSQMSPFALGVPALRDSSFVSSSTTTATSAASTSPATAVLPQQRL
jgi:hypothetical protein